MRTHSLRWIALCAACGLSAAALPAQTPAFGKYVDPKKLVIIRAGDFKK